MSKVLMEYEAKRQQLEALQAEVKSLESSEALKKELKFKGALEKLMDQYSKSAKDTVKVLVDIDPSIAKSNSNVSGTTRKPRETMVFKNPHTGEVVKTKGANTKTLKEWREKYGNDEVAKWRQD